MTKKACKQESFDLRTLVLLKARWGEGWKASTFLGFTEKSNF